MAIGRIGRLCRAASLVGALVGCYAFGDARVVPLSATARSMTMDECAGSHGEYWWTEWWDPDLNCQVELSGTDWFYAYDSIMAFEPVCSAEANWLINAAWIVEWTGNYNEGDYEWNAWHFDGVVGIQWPYMGDHYLWAHEAAHGYWGADEQLAQQIGFDCTHHLY